METIRPARMLSPLCWISRSHPRSHLRCFIRLTDYQVHRAFPPLVAAFNQGFLVRVEHTSRDGLDPTFVLEDTQHAFVDIHPLGSDRPVASEWLSTHPMLASLENGVLRPDHNAASAGTMAGDQHESIIHSAVRAIPISLSALSLAIVLPRLAPKLHIRWTIAATLIKLTSGIGVLLLIFNEGNIGSAYWRRDVPGFVICSAGCLSSSHSSCPQVLGLGGNVDVFTLIK